MPGCPTSQSPTVSSSPRSQSGTTDGGDRHHGARRSAFDGASRPVPHAGPASGEAGATAHRVHKNRKSLPYDLVLHEAVRSVANPLDLDAGRLVGPGIRSGDED